jgi:hypothetical protein
MAASGSRPHAPEGWPSLVPRLVVQGTREFVGFVQRVFGASGDYTETRPTER